MTDLLLYQTGDACTEEMSSWQLDQCLLKISQYTLLAAEVLNQKDN